jgi:hypothetical protein
MSYAPNVDVKACTTFGRHVIAGIACVVPTGNIEPFGL